MRVEEFHPLGADERVTLDSEATADLPPLDGATGGLSPLDGAIGDLWSEIVQLAGAEAVARYAGGGPAVTRHAVGAGVAWYVSTRLDYGDFFASVATAAGVEPECAGLPPGVEAIRRKDGERSWLFLLNHTAEDHDIPAAGVDLLTGAAVTGRHKLAAGGTAVIRFPPNG